MAELASPSHGCHVHTESCARTSDFFLARPHTLNVRNDWNFPVPAPVLPVLQGILSALMDFILQEAQESMESPDFSEASCLSSLFSSIAPGANIKKIEIFHLLVPGNRNHPSLCVGVWGQPDQLHKDSLIYSPEQSWSNSTGRERKQPADTGNCQEQPNLSGLNRSFSNSNIQMLRSTSLCTTLTSTIIQISLFSPKLEGNRDENKIKQVKEIFELPSL